MLDLSYRSTSSARITAAQNDKIGVKNHDEGSLYLLATKWRLWTVHPWLGLGLELLAVPEASLIGEAWLVAFWTVLTTMLEVKVRLQPRFGAERTAK